MPQIECKWAEMSHGRTRYFEAGDGPAVILLHGASFPSGGDTWFPVMPKLAEHFRVFAPDCLGFGPSDQLEQPYSFAYMVDHIREFQDVLGLSKSHIVGRSMGGWLAVLLAYESPERVEKMVNNSGGGQEARPLRGMVGWTPPGEEAIRKEMSIRGNTNIELEPLIEERIRLSHDEKHLAGFRNLMDHMTNPETRARYNTVRRMPHIVSPTLVLWGSNDQTNSIEIGHQCHDLISGSKMVVIEGGGHRLADERPEEFADATIEFLA